MAARHEQKKRPAEKLETWELRAAFAAGAVARCTAARCPPTARWSRSATEVNRDYVRRHPDAERLGSLRAGHRRAPRRDPRRQPAELAAVADLFAAFGMLPGRLLRPARRRLTGSGGFHRLPAHRQRRVGAQPVPGVHLDAGHRGRAILRCRPAAPRGVLPRAPSAVRPRAARPGPDDRGRRRLRRRSGAEDFVAAAVAAFALSREPIDKAWYDELSRVSAVAADIAGVALHPRQPPDAASARHRRAVPADDRARHHHDRRHPGPPRWRRARGAVAPDVVSRTGRTAPVSRRGRASSAGAACGCASAKSRRAVSR